LPKGWSLNPNRKSAHSGMRRIVCVCYDHSACGPNSASPAPLGPLCLRVDPCWMLPDRVAILKCGGRLSAIRNEADKNRLDRKQVRCLQWQWLFGGQATSATRPQDLPAAMSEVSGLRKNQKSRPLRRLADSTIGKPSARTPDAGYTMCWLTGPLARQTGRKVIEL
jgi:hypothetical protein